MKKNLIMKFFQLTFLFPKSELHPLTIKKTKKKKQHSPTSYPTKKNSLSESVKLVSIWNKLVDEYFEGSEDLKSYRLVWSKKIQTRCLASCNVTKKIVRVAPTMKRTDASLYLEPLLYHEMCHAVVGIKVVNGRRKIHTREFKQLERKHPSIASLDEWIEKGGWSEAVRKDIRNRRAI